MGTMNKQLKLPQIQKIMMDFEKQVHSGIIKKLNDIAAFVVSEKTTGKSPTPRKAQGKEYMYITCSFVWSFNLYFSEHFVNFNAVFLW